MNDKEIIKALECCSTYKGKCTDCPAFVKVDRSNCKQVLLGAIEIINRLQAENERLKANLNIELENYATEYDNKIKAEAYKEFADKIYEKVGFYITETNDTLNKMLLGEMQGTSNRKHYLYGGLSVLYEINSMLNNLLKELVGEDND